MININNSLLLIIDIQEKLLKVTAEKDLLVENTIKLIKGLKALDIPIVWVEQNPEKMGETTTEIAQELSGVKKFSKSSFSCFGDDSIREYIHEMDVDNVIVCGIESHVCVYQTVRDLLDDDYMVEIAVDCVSSRNLANKEIAVKRMVEEGADRTSVEMILFELLQNFKHPEFKTISSIIK
ncbi:MAG: isochorismatase family protein [Gammaproteobacteria bacterium]|nr:MAG: isochorismatase family protein [Gammaproteobacteria bacterium]